MRRGVRHWLRWLHLWAGVVLALPLALAGATGVVLAWADELAPAVDSPAWAASGSGDALSWPALVASLRPHAEGGRIAHIGGDRHGDRALRAWVDSPETGFQALLVDPRSGDVTVREPGEEWFKTIEALHRNLLLGPVGRQVIAWSSLALVLLAVVGIVLWWPMRRGTFSRLTGRGALLRWHNLAGLLALPLLVLFALTGVTLTWHGQVIPALYRLETGAGPPQAPTVEPSQERAPLARVFAAAREAVDGAEVRGYSEPDAVDGALRLRLRRPGSFHPTGWYFVHVDPADASIVRVRDAGGGSWAAWYHKAWYVLHTGAFLPALPRTIWALAAFTLPVLGVTGVWHWLRRRRRRGRARRERAAAAP